MLSPHLLFKSFFFLYQGQNNYECTLKLFIPFCSFSILSITIIKLSDVLEREAVEAMEVEHEDLIDITEEADLIQAERIIDDYDPREAQDSRKNKDDVRKLEEMMLVMNLDQDEIQHEEGTEEWKVNS